MGKGESGLLVLAKKTRGRFGEGKASDRWVLFKTDMPGTYLPKHKAWSDLVIKKNSGELLQNHFRALIGFMERGGILMRCLMSPSMRL